MHPTEIPLRFGMADEGRTLAIGEGHGDEWAAFSIEHFEAGDHFVAFFADYLQDQVLDQSTAAWGEARPICPGHPHPLVADVRESQAWWTCPKTDRQIVRIGEYAHIAGQ